MSIAPYDWLEASYFYYRPRDLRWKDGDGKVSREEFAVVAEKFPNILFPRMQAKKKEED